MAGEVLYHKLVPVTEPEAKIEPGFVLSTSAFITCGLCGGPISEHGGPKPDVVCNGCAELQLSGHIRDTVMWDEPDDEPSG